MNILSRAYIFLAQVFFTIALAPLLLWPRLAKRKLVRRFIAYSFGKFLSPRYHQVIDSFGSAYGAALETGLASAKSCATVQFHELVDCGTGTGFAACLMARRFPEAQVTGVDVVPDMLARAQANALAAGLSIQFRNGDLANLPLPDASFDLVVAQNTIPFLEEFARVCRPGGVVLFVDSAARWISGIGAYAAKRTGCFDYVESRRGGIGFYLVGRKAATATPP